MKRKIISLALIISILGSSLCAETTATATPTPGPHDPAPYTPTEFPDWVKKTRRFEVVTAGAFPLGMMYAGLTYDLIRYFRNSQDSQYLPIVGTYSPTPQENATTLLTALGFSLGVASLDLLIVHIKQDMEQKRLLKRMQLEKATKIILTEDSPEPSASPGDHATAPAETPSPAPQSLIPFPKIAPNFSPSPSPTPSVPSATPSPEPDA
jgi:hypothetical protein